MDDIVLTREEIKALTERTHRDAQMKALAHMSITFSLRPDGSLVVLRAHVEQLLGIKQEHRKAKRTYEPHWDALKDVDRS